MLYTGPIEWVEEKKDDEKEQEQEAAELIGANGKGKEEEGADDGGGGDGSTVEEGEFSSSKPVDIEEKAPEIDPNLVNALTDLRAYMSTLLQPLYDFMGSVEAELGGVDADYHFKFKSGVHSAQYVKSFKNLQATHPHIPPAILQTVWALNDPQIITHTTPVKKELDQGREAYVSEKRDEIVGGLEELQSEKGGVKTEPGIISDPDFTEWQVIGANDDETSEQRRRRQRRDEIWRQIRAKLPLVYREVLSFASHGALILVVEEINEATGKEFTLPQLVMSKSVRSMFARLVGKKLSVARSQAQMQRVNGGSARQVSYFISPSYRQLSAQSKWVMGAKIWFESAYIRQPRDDEEVMSLREIRGIMDRIFEAEDISERRRLLAELAEYTNVPYDVIRRVKTMRSRRDRRRHNGFSI
jgi:hypothetical protein